MGSFIVTAEFVITESATLMTEIIKRIISGDDFNLYR